MIADRYNQGKPRLSFLATRALRTLAQVYMYGAEKYNPDNWRKGRPSTDLIDSAMRHMFAYLEGEDVDPESGLSHAAHAAWNLLTLVEQETTHPELDDRYRPDPDQCWPDDSEEPLIVVDAATALALYPGQDLRMRNGKIIPVNADGGAGIWYIDGRAFRWAGNYWQYIDVESEYDG